MDAFLCWSSQGESTRDRALENMMGGAITVKKENILKKVGLQWTHRVADALLYLFHWFLCALICLLPDLR